MELNNLDIIDGLTSLSSLSNLQSGCPCLHDISSLNQEEFENYKNLLYKKYNILSKIYKIPKLDITEPFEKIHTKYYIYVNLLNHAQFTKI
jgi:hypothetical protein